MLRIDGTMIESKFSPGIIKTKKDPFLPMAVNVAGKDSPPEWHPVRVFASEAQLENLRERVKAGGNLLVRGGVTLFKRLSERDGTHYADAIFNTSANRLEAYDRDAKGFRRLVEMLEEPFVAPERPASEPDAEADVEAILAGAEPEPEPEAKPKRAKRAAKAKPEPEAEPVGEDPDLPF